MLLVPTKIQHLDILKTWVTDNQSARFWCGPGFRYPFTDEIFLQDIQWGAVPSYSLISREGELIGFGQYYENHGRCHLARIIVSPGHRGQGIGYRLVDNLIAIGLEDLALDECSLFVNSRNEKAVACYQSLGFCDLPYPEWQMYYDNINYMVRYA